MTRSGYTNQIWRCFHNGAKTDSPAFITNVLELAKLNERQRI